MDTLSQKRGGTSGISVGQGLIKIYTQGLRFTSADAIVSLEHKDLRELRSLLARRQREKAELEQQVQALREEYRREVAPLQEEVLRLQKERLKEAAQVYMRSARLRNAYHEAERAYESFRDQRRARSPSGEDLKATYRRASKQCHPDAVPNSYQEEAAATFQALESAYQARHESAVQSIAEALERWGFPLHPSAPIEDPAASGKNALRQAVSSLETSIEQLRASEAFDAIRQGGDLDTLIAAQKRELQHQLRKLQRQ